jgi:hypothetical protein
MTKDTGREILLRRTEYRFIVIQFMVFSVMFG